MGASCRWNDGNRGHIGSASGFSHHHSKCALGAPFFSQAVYEVMDPVFFWDSMSLPAKTLIAAIAIVGLILSVLSYIWSGSL